MKNQYLVASLVAALGVSAMAHAGQDYDDEQRITARVLSSTEIVERVNEPRRECWAETVGYDSHRVRGDNTGGSLLGAIAGGLLGSTVGKGNGRIAAAAVGAATGAVVGGRLGSDDRYESRPRQVERCTTHDNFRDVVVGYDVRYRFEGREYTTRLPYEPGKWIKLDVSHRVAGDQREGGWGRGREWD